MNKRITSLALVAALAIAATPAVLAQDGEPTYQLDPPAAADFGMVPNSADVAGQSVGDWVQALNEWWITTPFEQHYGPQNDCQAAQGGSVFYLSNVRFGTTQIFDCEIAADQHILVNVGGGFGWGNEPEDTPETLLNASLDNSAFTINPQVTVNGRSLPVGGSAWFQGQPYEFTLPEGNLFGDDAGTYIGVGNGWYMMLEPLAPGEHSIVISNEWLDPQIRVEALDDTGHVPVGNDGAVEIENPAHETIRASAVFNITVPESPTAQGGDDAASAEQTG